MWIRACIVLHNLILQIEDRAERFDADWREELYKGWDSSEDAECQRRQELQIGEDSGDESDLERARRRVRTDGQRFRLKLMSDLFNSPDSGAVH